MSNSSESLHEFTHRVIRSLGVKPNKSLGQNFLISSKARDRIIDLIDPGPETRIIEIGGGFGALSIPLAEKKTSLTVYEVDEILRNWLSKYLTEISSNIDVKGDFLKEYPPEDLKDRKFKIVGNIPYQITSPIFDIVYSSQCVPSEIVLMMQKEVAERIGAQPHSKNRGRLTLWCEYHADIVKSLDVKSGAFYPPPKVGSTVLQMVTKKHFPLEESDKKLFFELVKTAFAMKRKTLINNIIHGYMEPDRDCISAVLKSNKIDERSRAEDLSLSEFILLFNNVKDVLRIKEV